MKGFGLTLPFLVASLSSVDARGLDLPKATNSLVLPADGWTPKPTPPAALNKRVLRRQSDDDEDDDEGTTVLVAPDNTCGYVSGRPGAPFTCALDYSCVFFTASETLSGNVACCDNVDCGVRLACIDYDAYYSSSACDDGCRVDAFTLKCVDSDMPYCNTMSFAGSIFDYWCNNVQITGIQSVTTAYRGQDHSFSPLALTDESTSLSIVADTSAVGPTITSDPTPTGGDDSSDDEDDSSDNSNSGDSNSSKDGGGGGTPVGPIVGGVVGGVGALGLAGLGLWLFLRQKKKKQAAAAVAEPSPATTYAPVQQQGPPPPGAPGQQPYNSPQGYYDPKFVAAGQGYQPYPQQQPPPQQQGGYYPMGSASPPPQSASSPTMSNINPSAVSSPTASYPSGYPSGVPTQQGGFVHEAPSRPDETHRGGVHEMG